MDDKTRKIHITQCLSLFFIMLITAAAGFIAYYSRAQSLTTQEYEQQRLRPYVGVAMPQSEFVNNFNPPTVPMVNLNLRNSGQTPAYNVTHFRGMNIGVYPLPADYDFSLIIPGPGSQSNPLTILPGTIESGELKISRTTRLSENEMESIKNGQTVRLYAWGTVNYDDSLGKHHYTNFCFSFFSLTDTSVSYEHCNSHNDAN